jgi:alpha-ketoglutarate-dependent taurine dioxygenase
MRIAELFHQISSIKNLVESDGFASLGLDRRLDDSEFIELGRLFGTLIPESAPEIAGFVSDRYILNLRTEIPRGAPTELQPFAADPLTFHTEGSGRPLGKQPNLLIFQCIVPPPPDGGGQTLLRSAAQLGAMLSPAGRATLAGMSYDHDGMPPIFRDHGGGEFSFRDLGDEPMPWRLISGDGNRTAADVDGAFRELLLALYDGRHVRGIRWRPNDLVLIRNQRYFHGRSAADGKSGRAPRHIRRLRVW